MRSGAADGFFDPELEKRFVDGMAEFAAGVGHELNNPLAVISGLAQTLMLDEQDGNKRRMLAGIVEQTGRAYEMITSIRSFARPPKPEPQGLSVSEFFQDWARRERERYRSSDVLLACSDGGITDGTTITTDPAILGAILDAFARNAYDALRFRSVAMESSNADVLKGRVSLFAEESKTIDGSRRLILGVEDDGPGLSDEARELAFSPFYSGRQAGRGLGVGLAKAWRYAEVLGAAVQCEAAVAFPTGCRWTVVLPMEKREGEGTLSESERDAFSF